MSTNHTQPYFSLAVQSERNEYRDQGYRTNILTTSEQKASILASLEPITDAAVLTEAVRIRSNA